VIALVGGVVGGLIVDATRSSGSSGDAACYAIGQPVVALGAPLGLSSTVTAGIVSALDRTVEVPAGNGVTALLIGAVQTDASINPGNSGGPLVDCAGRLVGVNTAGATVPNPAGPSSPGSVGLNFAVPVDLAIAVADEIIDTGSVTHADVGLTAVPLPQSVSHPSGVDHGLLVTSVTSGGPAAEAGLRPGDLITDIDGQAATTTQQLLRIELTKAPGETVMITYQRTDQAPATTTLTLGARPSTP
jgi:putative serine protease PepD